MRLVVRTARNILVAGISVIDTSVADILVFDISVIDISVVDISGIGISVVDISGIGISVTDTLLTYRLLTYQLSPIISY